MTQALDYLKETPSQTAGPYVHIGLMPTYAGNGDYYDEEIGTTPFIDESKAKVAEKRKEQNKAKANAAKKARKDMPKFKSGSSKADKKVAPKEKLPPAEKLQDTHLKPGTAVTVKLGKAPMPATITEIAKDGIQVQLDTGMTVKVQVDNLRLAQPKR